MQKSSIVFLISGFASLLVAFVMEGGSPAGLLAPTAAIIVFGGTIGAVGLSFPFEELKEFPKALKTIFFFQKRNLVEEILYFKEVSGKTRAEGLLAFDKELEKITEPFLKKGLRMVVDGFDAAAVRTIMEKDMELMTIRHKVPAEICESAGGFSPTMGVVGTVMGLINVLGNLSEPDKLGGAIALAFIATLYGVAFANLVYLPIGSKLKAFHKQEMYEKDFYMEGVLLIQEGANTFMLIEKLKGFLTHEQKHEFERMQNKNPEGA
ncbi:MAG: motility protein A [Candidatus Margulisiibacteriota bacterium]